MKNLDFWQTNPESFFKRHILSLQDHENQPKEDGSFPSQSRKKQSSLGLPLKKTLEDFLHVLYDTRIIQDFLPKNSEKDSSTPQKKEKKTLLQGTETISPGDFATWSQILQQRWHLHGEDINLPTDKTYLWFQKLFSFAPYLGVHQHQGFFFPSFSVAFALNPLSTTPLTLEESVEKFFQFSQQSWGLKTPFGNFSPDIALKPNTFPLNPNTPSFDSKTFPLNPNTPSFDSKTFPLNPNTPSFDPNAFSLNPNTSPLDSNTFSLDANTSTPNLTCSLEPNIFGIPLGSSFPQHSLEKHFCSQYFFSRLVSFYHPRGILYGGARHYTGPKLLLRCSFSEFFLQEEGSWSLGFFTTKDNPSWISLEKGEALSTGLSFLFISLGFHFFQESFLLFLKNASLYPEKSLDFSEPYGIQWAKHWHSNNHHNNTFTPNTLNTLHWIFFHKPTLEEKIYAKNKNNLLETYGLWLYHFLNYMDTWATLKTS